MKWRAHRQEDGTVDPLVIKSDTHSIIWARKNLFICFRFGKPAVIIGRWSTADLARQCCASDYPGKPYPPDDHTTYSSTRQTLDAPEVQEVRELAVLGPERDPV